MLRGVVQPHTLAWLAARAINETKHSLDSQLKYEETLTDPCLEILRKNMAMYRSNQETLNVALLHATDAVRIKKLLKVGADPNQITQYGNTLLHQWVAIGHLEVVINLLEYGADIHEKDDRGYTALHYAVENDQLEMVSLLLRQNADVNAVSQYKRTALHLALTKSTPNPKIVALLLFSKPDLTIKNCDDISILDLLKDKKVDSNTIVARELKRLKTAQQLKVPRPQVKGHRRLKEDKDGQSKRSRLIP